jgi:hypothetical protein
VDNIPSPVLFAFAVLVLAITMMVGVFIYFLVERRRHAAAAAAARAARGEVPSWQAVAKPIDREREIAALVKLLAVHLDAMPAKKRQAMIQKIALALRKD